MKKAVIYSRVSTEKQNYERQTEDLLKYAKEHSYEVVEVLEEKDSGFNDDRTEFNKLLSYTDIDIILVWELTRLSRRSIKLQQTVYDFINRGIAVYAYKDNFCTHNADGSINEVAKLVLAMSATIAESEAKTLQKRCVAGRDFKRINSTISYTPIAPYGYKLVNKKLVIDEEAAETVRTIFKMSLDGIGLRYIHYYLQTPSKKWGNCTLVRILRNTVYKGYVDYKGVRINTPQIVSEEVWDNVQQHLDNRKSKRCLGKEKRDIQYYLRGLIECPFCGRHYVYRPRPNMYECISNISSDYVSDSSTRIKGTELDKCVWYVTQILFREDINERYLADKKVPYEVEKSELLSKMEELAKKRTDKVKESKKCGKLALLYMDTNKELYSATLEEIKKLGKEIEAYDAEIERLQKSVLLLKEKIDNIGKGLSMEITDTTEKIDFLHKVIDKIVVYGSRGKKVVQIFYKTGTIYDILLYKRKWYYFKNEGCVKYGTKFAEVTGEGMFSKEVLGYYTYDNYFGLLQTHNLLNLIK